MLKENVIERIGELTDGHRADVCIEVIGSKATFEQARADATVLFQCLFTWQC